MAAAERRPPRWPRRSGLAWDNEAILVVSILQRHGLFVNSMQSPVQNSDM
jgi:hypothetical protein